MQIAKLQNWNRAHFDTLLLLNFKCPKTVPRYVVDQSTKLKKEKAIPVNTHRALDFQLSCTSDCLENSAAVEVPRSSETARTVVSIVNHGTLSTVSDDGHPLGTYVTYVLDKQGNPIIRLRSNALHTANLDKDSRCSLFIIPEEFPARKLARVSILGTISALSPSETEEYRRSHNDVHEAGIGVDRPKLDDLFFRLSVEKVFYVGGIAPGSVPATISGDDYFGSSPDPLRNYVSEIIAQWNSEHIEDVIRICKVESGVPLMKMSSAELMWIDRLGLYFKYKTIAEDSSTESHTLRVPFPRVVDDERDVRSVMTMMAHLAWEKEKSYVPKMPSFASLQKP